MDTQFFPPNATITMNKSLLMKSLSDISMSDPVTWSLVLISLALFISGVCGNVFVLLVYKHRYSPSTFREFICILAVLDLCVIIFTLPLTSTMLLLERHPFVFRTAHVYFAAFGIARFMGYATISSSVFVLMIIAIDRYIRVCHPLRRAFDVTKARVLCGAATVAAAIINIPAGFANDALLQRLHLGVLASVLGVIGVTMVTLYILIWRRLRARSNIQGRSPSPGEKVADRSLQSTRRTSKIFFAVTLLLVFTVVPHFIIGAIIMFAGWGFTPAHDILYNLAFLFPYINSVGNPLIYSLFSLRFRKEAGNVLAGLRASCVQCTSCPASSGHLFPSPSPFPPVMPHSTYSSANTRQPTRTAAFLQPQTPESTSDETLSTEV